MTAASALALDELPPRGITPVWSELAERARRERGWHLVGHDLCRSTAHHIQIGRYAAFRPAGAWEARVRDTRGTRATVYVRFRGKRTAP